ncbi:MAG: DUF1822 family protein [Cyanobacteria bacterium J06598_1]
MVLTHSQHLGITLPITTEFQQVAQRFAQNCPFEEKAVQIRRNTLAVCVVDSYLQLMDIPSAIAQGDSWKPMMQMMSDVADLPLPEAGVLSCRVVDTVAETCYIPPEAWDERMGYVAVALDEAAQTATLLGFSLSAHEMEQLPLSRFEPIESLLEEVHRLRTSKVGQRAENLLTTGRAALTRLGDWLSGGISASWQPVDALVNPVELGFAFRTTSLATPEVTTDVSRAKLVDLGVQMGESVRVALVVHMTAEDMAEDRAELGDRAPNQSSIVLQVRPLGDSPYLVEDLTLAVLDETGQTFSSATSREIDNYIQLRLSGQSGESFRVRITMGEATFTEQFSI